MDDNFKFIDELYSNCTSNLISFDAEIFQKVVALAKENEDCLKYVINYIQDENHPKRIITTLVIREVGNAAYLIKILQENYTNSPSRLFSYAQYLIVENLGHIGDKRAIPILIKLLDNEVSDVRGGAVQALGKLEAVEALAKIEYIAEHDDAGYGWFDTMKEIAAEVAEKLRQHKALATMQEL
jgi:HEAT repeat protein